MKYLILTICTLLLSITSMSAQNEWWNGWASPNNLTDDMFRQGNVGIGAAFLSSPPTIPLAIDADQVGTKVVFGGQNYIGSYKPEDAVLELQSNFASSSSYLGLKAGLTGQQSSFYMALSLNPAYEGCGFIATNNQVGQPLHIDFWTHSNVPPYSLSRRMIIKPEEKVGVAVDDPLATFHVSTNPQTLMDGSVVFEGPSFLGLTAPPPITGTGTRLMWYPDYGAFRCGYLSTIGSTFWDQSEIGKLSFAVGEDTRASGDYSFAACSLTNAVGNNSFAIGATTLANGDYSFASGYGTQTQSPFSSSFGFLTIAFGPGSAAFGESTHAEGSYSIAMGSNTYAKSLDAFAIGRYNEQLGTNSGWNATDPIFQIGIGTVVVPQDAVTVLKNGNFGLGQSSPSHLLELGVDDAHKPGTATWGVISDKRLKKDIQDYTKGLSVLRKIHPVTFHYNGQGGLPTSETAVGIIAQKIQEILPGTVKKSKVANLEDEYLNFNPNELFYLLINSVKELANDIDTLKYQYKLLNDTFNKFVLSNANNKIQDDLQNSINAQNSKVINDSHSSNRIIKIIPNPTNRNTRILYQLSGKNSSAVIVIQNSEGKIIYSEIISKTNDGELNFDASIFYSGVYFCNLWVDGRKADTRLIVLNK